MISFIYTLHLLEYLFVPSPQSKASPTVVVLLTTLSPEHRIMPGMKQTLHIHQMNESDSNYADLMVWLRSHYLLICGLFFTIYKIKGDIQDYFKASSLNICIILKCSTLFFSTLYYFRNVKLYSILVKLENPKVKF